MIIQNNFNNYSILDEHLVIRNDSIGNIPLLESSNENKYNVEYKYIENLMESYGYEIDEVIGELLRENNIDIEQLSISVLESDAIKNIEDVNFFNENGIDYEINPISNNDIISIYIDRLVESWLDTGNDKYITLLKSPELLMEEEYEPKEDVYNYDKSDLSYSYETKKKMWKYDANAKKGKIDVYYYDKDKDQYYRSKKPYDFTDANFLVKIKRFLTDKPRDFLAKVAARLRETYRKWLIKAKDNHNKGNEKWYKRIARRLVQAIDWILRKIEGFKVQYHYRVRKYMEDEFPNHKNLVGAAVTYNGNGEKEKGLEYFTFRNGKSVSDLYKKTGRVKKAASHILWGKEEKPDLSSLIREK